MKRRRTSRTTRPSLASQVTPRYSPVVAQPSLQRLVQREVSRQKNTTEEIKSYDALFDTTASSAGQILALTPPMNQGTANTQRMGRAIYIKSIHMRCHINTIANDVYDTVRVMIFQWMDETTPTAAAVAATDILEDIGTNPFLSALSTDNGHKVRVLHDKMYNVSENGDWAATDKIFKKVNSKAKWKVGVAAIETGQLFCMIISDSLALPHPRFRANFRTRYTDS